MPSQFGVASGVLYPFTCQAQQLGWKEPQVESWVPD